MKPRLWLGLWLLLPGGLLIALGLLAVWPGLALLVSGLRRMTAPTGDAGRADEVTTPTPMQPYGQPCQPSPRTLDYALESPDHVPGELQTFAERGFARLNRWRES